MHERIAGFRIDSVPIAAQAKMLRRVQCRQRLDRIRRKPRQGRRVGFDEVKALNILMKWSNIYYGYFAKYKQMRDKSINPRSDIKVIFWIVFEYFFCRPQVLKQILTSATAGLTAPVIQAGISIGPSSAKILADVGAIVLSEMCEKSRPATH